MQQQIQWQVSSGDVLDDLVRFFKSKSNDQINLYSLDVFSFFYFFHPMNTILILFSLSLKKVLIIYVN